MNRDGTGRGYGEQGSCLGRETETTDAHKGGGDKKEFRRKRTKKKVDCVDEGEREGGVGWMNGWARHEVIRRWNSLTLTVEGRLLFVALAPVLLSREERRRAFIHSFSAKKKKATARCTEAGERGCLKRRRKRAC